MQSGGDEPRPPPRLVLVGMMGSGKTTVGRLVAARLGVPFADTDEEMETVHRAERERDVLRPKGEPAFRRRESEVLACIARAATARVSSRRGEDAVLDRGNRAPMRSARRPSPGFARPWAPSPTGSAQARVAPCSPDATGGRLAEIDGTADAALRIGRRHRRGHRRPRARRRRRMSSRSARRDPAAGDRDQHPGRSRTAQLRRPGRPGTRSDLSRPGLAERRRRGSWS